jgi:hypothetical protein
MANWTRYTGVVFLPLLAISVFVLADGRVAKRAGHGIAALALAVLVVLPLWRHNLSVSGKLSGSDRGGLTAHAVERLLSDIETAIELFKQSLFAFDMLIRAHLAVPMALLASYLLVRSIRKLDLKMTFPVEVWLPGLWLIANLAFLFYARIAQRTVDMDFRMVAIAAPFFFFAITPWINRALSDHKPSLAKIFSVLVLGLFSYTGIQESMRVHANYLDGKAPGWRPNFGLVYRDLTEASLNTRLLKENIEHLAQSPLLLTDYRALYIRYLIGANAYAVHDENACKAWVSRYSSGILLIGMKDSVGWAQACVNTNSGWRLHQVIGRAAPSMMAQ